MRMLKSLAMGIGVLALLVSAASAQDLGDATRKARGDYGQHRAVLNNSVQRAASSAQRTFSYEPAANTPANKAPATHAPPAVKAPAAPGKPAVAQPPAPSAQPRRTFSYEPQGVRSSRGMLRRETPSLLLPKGDPRRTAPVIHW